MQKKIGNNHGKRRINSRTSMAQREEVIKRTVYVSDIDHQVRNYPHLLDKNILGFDFCKLYCLTTFLLRAF